MIPLSVLEYGRFPLHGPAELQALNLGRLSGKIWQLAPRRDIKRPACSGAEHFASRNTRPDLLWETGEARGGIPTQIILRRGVRLARLVQLSFAALGHTRHPTFRPGDTGICALLVRTPFLASDEACVNDTTATKTGPPAPRPNASSLWFLRFLFADVFTMSFWT